MNIEAISRATQIAQAAEMIHAADDDPTIHLLVESLGPDPAIGDFLVDYSDPKAGVTKDELLTGLCLAAARACLAD